MNDMDINRLISSREYREALALPCECLEEYRLLAQGEYNANYVFDHPVTGQRLVLRINTGSQMHLERQIEYEAHALGILAGCGRTPRVIYTDGSKSLIPYGVLVMEYLPGRYPVYESVHDMSGVMKCMADIHSAAVPESGVVYGEPFGEDCVPSDTVKLIAPGSPEDSIIDECENMLKVYTDSDMGGADTKQRLRRLLDAGHRLAKSCATEPPVRCCINTELNSTNFLVDDTGFVRLVDWEKPLYGDPAQDLGHLLAPTTTFWKTDTVLGEKETGRLIDEYMSAAAGRYDTDGLKDRTRDLINITCLRGLTWCAMAWVEYNTPGRAITNESTRRKLGDYLSDSFISDIEKRFAALL